jgi:hypothetical protein
MQEFVGRLVVAEGGAVQPLEDAEPEPEPEPEA